MNEPRLGASLSQAFKTERDLVDQLVTGKLELPWCRDVAVGKKAKLKYHYGPRWWVIGEGRWTEYSRARQSIERTMPVGQGGFDFSWELTGDRLSFRVVGSYRGQGVNEEGTLTVSAYDRCDECDDGGRNNQTELKGSSVNGKVDCWPKNRDRTRIVITEPGGKEHELEIDTNE